MTSSAAPSVPVASAASPQVGGARRSCIYEGNVVHWRRGRVDHAFRRSVYLLYLDLAELPGVLEHGRLWSAQRRALARFDRRDYLGDPDVPLDLAVRDLVQERTGRRPEGPIGMLTQVRHLGIGFNPITVYYCHDATGARVETLVAEVRNTPWLERHCYVLPLEPKRGRGAHRLACSKSFHVSPFMEMDYTYRWRVSEPGENALVHIEMWHGEERRFGATLRAHRRPLDARSLRRMQWRYPLMSAQVIGGIYLEALRLWRKGATFVSHPKYAEAGPPTGDARPDSGRLSLP